MGIKQLKPSPNSRYHQSYAQTDKLKKLINKTQPVIVRSSYERSFIMWLESCKHVKAWASEAICIPYVGPDGNVHNYYPDFYVEFDNGTRWVVEIKPYNQTKRPVNENGWAWNEYMKNCCKWRAAIKFCKDRQAEFHIITEKIIDKLKK